MLSMRNADQTSASFPGGREGGENGRPHPGDVEYWVTPMILKRNDWLRWRSLSTPGKLAVLNEERSVSYAELDKLAGGLAAGLGARGLKHGDKIAMHMGNSVEAIALIHAVARAGAVLVPLNTRLAPAERERQLRLVEPALLVHEDVASKDGGSVSAASRPEFPASSENGATLPEVVTVSELARDGLYMCQDEEEVGPAPAHWPDPQLQSIVFTSGTTGIPKGVELSFDNHFWSATASSYRLGIDTEDRWLSCLPLYHVGGLAVVFRSCLYGTAIVLQRSFDQGRFQRCLREDGVTLTSLVPTMLHRLLNSSPATEWPESLRLVLLGGAAAAPELLRAASDVGVPVAATYGLTETASQVATALPADISRKPESVGRPLMYTELRITGPDGRALRPGGIGEILVRGPQVMAGYHANESATEQAVRRGWLHTGDMGFVDDDGDLFVVQRRSDMIVSGGENIYPVEVEATLREHPAVAEVCVVGLPDEEWGQRCAAAVQLHAGETVTQDALLAFSRDRLAGYKQPSAKYIRFVDALPETASGKIARREVVTLFEDFN